MQKKNLKKEHKSETNCTDIRFQTGFKRGVGFTKTFLGLKLPVSRQFLVSPNFLSEENCLKNNRTVCVCACVCVVYNLPCFILLVFC